MNYARVLLNRILLALHLVAALADSGAPTKSSEKACHG